MSNKLNQCILRFEENLKAAETCLTETKDHMTDAVKEKVSRGGKRKGAGRKPAPTGKKRITRSINLKPENWQKLDTLADTKGQTRSAWIEEHIERTKLEK